MQKDIIKKIIPFIPFLIVLVLLLIKPYYIFPTTGDIDYHLLRAQEILQNPIHGLFWDYLIYPPDGRCLWHPPLFHSILAFLWYIGGVRFAHSILCIFQILLTVFVASWVAKEEYGNLAGFFAGILSLACNRIDILAVPIPVAYIPILAVLTIHYIPKDKYKALITSVIGVWTHMIGLLIFISLFIADGLKNKSNIKMILLLLPSILFWAAYWFLFKDQSGTSDQIKTLTFSLPPGNNLFGMLILLVLGITGLYYLHHLDKERFKLYLTYALVTFISTEFLFGDFARFLQSLSLPLAILSGLAIKKIYDYTNENYKTNFSRLIIASIIIISFIGSLPFFMSLTSVETNWNQINTPFDYKYTSLNEYINENTSQNETLWAEPPLAEKIAWMTGRKIANSQYGDPNYSVNHQHQNLNFYLSNNTFLIKNYENNTVKEIPANN